MIVRLNDKLYKVTAGTTLDMFIESLDIPLQGVAVAVDYEVIPRSEWFYKKLTEGMTLILIHATSGG